MLKNWKWDQVQALNRILQGKSVVHKDYTQTGSVASGDSEVTQVTAPDGKIWLLKTLFMAVSPDADATSGSHELILRVRGTYNKVLYGKSSYDTEVLFRYGHWITADLEAQPPDSTVPQKILTSVLIDDTYGMDFKYNNNTDVAQENDRRYRLDALEVTVS